MMKHRKEIERLFKVHYEQMYRLAISILHDEDIARDVVQEVFLTLIENKRQKVSASYLLSATKNRALNHIRDINIHQRLLHLYLIEDSEYDEYLQTKEDMLLDVNGIVENDLKDTERRIIKLRFLKSLKFSEISRDLGISETAIYRHVKNALKTIKQKLIDHGQI